MTQISHSEAQARLKELEALTAQRESDVKTTAEAIEKLKAEGVSFAKLSEAINKHQAATYLLESHQADLEKARTIVDVAKGDEEKERLIASLIARVEAANACYGDYQTLTSQAQNLIRRLREVLLEVSAKRSELIALKNNALALVSYPVTRAQKDELLKELESRGLNLAAIKTDQWQPAKSFDEVMSGATPGLDLATARTLNHLEHELSYSPKGK